MGASLPKVKQQIRHPLGGGKARSSAPATVTNKEVPSVGGEQPPAIPPRPARERDDFYPVEPEEVEHKEPKVKGLVEEIEEQDRLEEGHYKSRLRVPSGRMERKFKEPDSPMAADSTLYGPHTDTVYEFRYQARKLVHEMAYDCGTTLDLVIRNLDQAKLQLSVLSQKLVETMPIKQRGKGKQWYSSDPRDALLPCLYVLHEELCDLIQMYKGILATKETDPIFVASSAITWKKLSEVREWLFECLETHSYRPEDELMPKDIDLKFQRQHLFMSYFHRLSMKETNDTIEIKSLRERIVQLLARASAQGKDIQSDTWQKTSQLQRLFDRTRNYVDENQAADRQLNWEEIIQDINQGEPELKRLESLVHGWVSSPVIRSVIDHIKSSELEHVEEAPQILRRTSAVNLYPLGMQREQGTTYGYSIPQAYSMPQIESWDWTSVHQQQRGLEMLQKCFMKLHIAKELFRPEIFNLDDKSSRDVISSKLIELGVLSITAEAGNYQVASATILRHIMDNLTDVCFVSQDIYGIIQHILATGEAFTSETFVSGLSEDVRQVEGERRSLSLLTAQLNSTFNNLNHFLEFGFSEFPEVEYQEKMPRSEQSVVEHEYREVPPPPPRQKRVREQPISQEAERIVSGQQSTAPSTKKDMEPTSAPIGAQSSKQGVAPSEAGGEEPAAAQGKPALKETKKKSMSRTLKDKLGMQQQ